LGQRTAGVACVLVLLLAVLPSAPAAADNPSSTKKAIRDCIVDNAARYFTPDKALLTQYIDLADACRAAFDKSAEYEITITPVGSDSGLLPPRVTEESRPSGPHEDEPAAGTGSGSEASGSGAAGAGSPPGGTTPSAAQSSTTSDVAGKPTTKRPAAGKTPADPPPDAVSLAAARAAVDAEQRQSAFAVGSLSSAPSWIVVLIVISPLAALLAATGARRRRR